MTNSKHQRLMRAIAKHVNDLECAHIDRASTRIGVSAWHLATARMYDATAELVDLGVPMTLGGAAAPAVAAAELRRDAANNREVARIIERNA